MHCALCCVRGSLYVLCGECFVYRVCVLRVVVFIVCVVTVNGHEGTAALRLLPRDIFSQDTGFPASGATVQFMSMTYGHLLQKDLGGFLHQPRGSVQCPGEGAHITLVLGYIILNASKVVSSHLTQSHSQGRGTKPGGRMLLPSPSTFCLLGNGHHCVAVGPAGHSDTVSKYSTGVHALPHPGKVHQRSTANTHCSRSCFSVCVNLGFFVR